MFKINDIEDIILSEAYFNWLMSWSAYNASTKSGLTYHRPSSNEKKSVELYNYIFY